MDTALQNRANGVATVSDPGNLIAAIARAASDPSVDVTKMERLFAMHEAMVQRQARVAFDNAMADFKAEAPTIVKGKEVKFGQTQYKHATLAMVCDAVIEALSRHGVTHRWDLQQDKGAVRVTCILTHRDGHSQSTPLEAPPDISGQMNAIQRVASAVTYLQRYTLLAATGLSTTDQAEDDGRGTGHGEKISDGQLLDIETMLRDRGIEIAKFKKWAKVSDIGEILAKNYQTCVDRIKEHQAPR